MGHHYGSMAVTQPGMHALHTTIVTAVGSQAQVDIIVKKLQDTSQNVWAAGRMRCRLMAPRMTGGVLMAPRRTGRVSISKS